MLALCAPVATQCRDPNPPGGGFPLQRSPSVDIRFSDGYRTRASVTQPAARPGTCGWPIVVLVPGLGASRATTDSEAAATARAGYLVVSYDVRGQAEARALNPGRGSMLWALDEWIDLAEVIDWAAATYRSAADLRRVAVAGDSQGGIHAWAAAAWSGKRLPANARRARPFPRISCVVSRVFPPQTVDVLVPGGTSFYYRLAEFAFAPKVASVELDPRFRSRIGAFLDAGDPPGLAGYLRGIAGKDFTHQLATTRVPVLAAVSWHDQFTTPDLALAALAMLPKTTPRRAFLTTGLHGTPLNVYEFLVRQEITRDWLDRFMKKGREPVEQGPPVLAAAIPADPRLYGHTLYLWRHRAGPTYPPANLEMRRFYLRSGARLTPDKPRPYEGPGLLTHHVQSGYDARAFQRDGAKLELVRKHVPFSALLFFTQPMTEDVEIAGPPSVTLSLRPTHPDAQVGLRLIALTADGRPQVVASGGLGLRGADTGRARAVRIAMGATMSVIPRGTRLVLEVSDQAVQTPGMETIYRLLPVFHDYRVTVGYGPGRLSFLDLPLRRSVRGDLSTGETRIQLARPGPKTLVVRSSARWAGLDYVIVASLSGQTPLPLPGHEVLYLSRDALTTSFVALANGPLLPGFAGRLDARGSALARLALGPIGPLPPGLAGVNLHLAPIIFGPGVLSAGAPLQLRFE